jgi:elongation factor G
MTGDPHDALSPTVKVRLGAESGDEYNLTLSLTGSIQLWGLLSQYSPIKEAFSELSEPIRSSRADAFVPAIEVEIEAIATADAARLASELSELAAGDEQFRFTVDDATGRAKLAGIEEQQLDQKIESLRRSHGIELVVSPPQIAYRETIKQRVEVDYAHKMQRGGAGEFARVELAVEPNPLGTSWLFRNRTSDDSLPSRYVAGIEKGVAGALAAGVLAGFPAIRLNVFLLDGAYHDLDSSPLAFEIAARAAMREAVHKAEPVLLEPVMRVAIVTPEDHIGAILKDLVSRRGQIQDRGRDWRSARIIVATVPAANLLGYAASLRQTTQGHAGYAQRFDHYAPMPQRDDPPFRPAIAMRV